MPVDLDAILSQKPTGSFDLLDYEPVFDHAGIAVLAGCLKSFVFFFTQGLVIEEWVLFVEWVVLLEEFKLVCVDPIFFQFFPS